MMSISLLGKQFKGLNLTGVIKVLQRVKIDLHKSF